MKDKTNFYLAGPIMNVKDPSNWRREYTQKLHTAGYGVYDPLLGHQCYIEMLKGYVEREQEHKLIKLYRDEIIPVDLVYVKLCDAVILRLNKNEKTAGSIVECYEAWKQDKPVFWVTDMTLADRARMTWLNAFITKVAGSIDELIAHLDYRYHRD